jgi:hypothetical protein
VGKLRPPKPKGYGRLAAPEPEMIDQNTLKVVFGFQHLEYEYALNGATNAQVVAFLDALRMRSQITWSQINSAPRQKLGFEKIADALRIGVPAQIPEKCHDRIVCFRFGGDLERFIGYREGATFEVVWIDHDGRAYDHGS